MAATARDVTTTAAGNNSGSNFTSARRRRHPPSSDLKLTNHSSPEVEPVYNRPPVQLLQGKGNKDSDTSQSLEDKCMKRMKHMKHMYGLLPGRIVLVDCHDVVRELLGLYKDDGILCTKLSLSFVDETALGDGVLREVFSTFWDSFLARFCEGNKQFVFIPRPSLPHEDYVAVGRIIRQFVLTGTFPVQVAEAQMTQTIFGQVSEDCLASSFLQLLRERERQIRAPNTLQSSREGWSVFHRRNSRHP